MRLVYGAARFDRRLSGSWRGAHAALRSGRYSAVSVDCFDTILCRSKPDWEQRAIADLVIELANLDGRTADALLQRAHASAARASSGAPEPSAIAIWRNFCGLAKIPGELANVLCRCELQLLESSITLEPNASSFINEVFGLRMPVVVCSDTRWPSASLAKVLHRKGLKLAENALVCSCDHEVSKFLGGLFLIARDRLSAQMGQQILPAHILHIGDNYLSDICSGACFGMTTILVRSSCVTDAISTYESSYLPAIKQEILTHLRSR
jgi:FMN phosphatase YigB (HAD superfamily)